MRRVRRLTIGESPRGEFEDPAMPPLRWVDLGLAPWVEPAYHGVKRLAGGVRRRMRWFRPWIALAAMVLAYAGIFGRLTWLQQSNYGTADYDMGIFDQEIWLAAHHLNPFLTIRGLNMWANHVNPVIYLLVPFYWLGAGPHFLFLVQTLAVASAAVPLWLLARDRFSSPWLALGIPFAWLMYPAVEWMTWDQFHPELLAVPALIFAYWLADRGYWRWYAASRFSIADGNTVPGYGWPPRPRDRRGAPPPARSLAERRPVPGAG